MKWMVPEEKLSAEQREIMDNLEQLNNRPIWVQGHAGSGKSVVLLYALNDYIITNPNAKVAVVVFTYSLKDLLESGLKQIPTLKNKFIPVKTIYQMKKSISLGEKYDGIFCDEIQDLPIEFIQSMHQNSKQFVIAGDSAQSIYETDPFLRLETASPEQINQTIKSENYVLTSIFRLTENVLNILRNVFSTLLNSKTHIGKENTDIRLFKADNYHSESKWVWDEAKLINENRPSEVTAILFYKKDDILDFINQVLSHENKPTWPVKHILKFGSQQIDFNNLNNYLANKHIPLVFIGNGQGSLDEADRQNKIVVMTYHSSKGLDFDAVFLPKANTDLSRAYNPLSLALVALSRSKRDLIITFTNSLSSTFNKFLQGTKVRLMNDSSDQILF